MEPPRVDYEVRNLGGCLLLTTDDPEIARAWADTHCAPRYPLVVERVEHHRIIIHTATWRREAAS